MTNPLFSRVPKRAASYSLRCESAFVLDRAAMQRRGIIPIIAKLVKTDLRGCDVFFEKNFGTTTFSVKICGQRTTRGRVGNLTARKEEKAKKGRDRLLNRVDRFDKMEGVLIAVGAKPIQYRSRHPLKRAVRDAGENSYEFDRFEV